MAIFKLTLPDWAKPKKKAQPQQAAQFTGYGNGNGTYRTLFAYAYNGEKNLGELGPPKSYWVDYDTLRVRSWQQYLESELAQTVVNKYTRWVIGKGLKLQAEPFEAMISAARSVINTEELSTEIETRFAVYANSKMADYANRVPLNKIQERAHKNAKVGGDVLVILRFIEGIIKVQTIDGQNVVQPLRVAHNLQFFEAAEANKNRIENGIELSPENNHIAYYVRVPGNVFDTQRVVAVDSGSGLRMAYMVYGSEYRIDNMRGLPLLSVIMETLKKLERYKEATVGSAEELAKISYQIVHQQYSTGESPLMDQLAKAHDISATADLAKDIDGRELANTVAATQNKQTYNNPLGAEIKTINPNKYQLYFKDFYGMNIDLVCACVGIPPDVALSKYNSNYSASRAAIKDWEHTLEVERADFASQFMEPIYKAFLYVEMLKGTINVPGMMQAWFRNDRFLVEAYCNARWVGAAVPHIDPLKEVQAERLKLGPRGANMPLTTVEAATEALNCGDGDANMKQFSSEFKESKKLGIEPTPEEIAASKPQPAKKPTSQKAELSNEPVLN